MKPEEITYRIDWYETERIGSHGFAETLRENADGTGFTLTTIDPKSAFAMAEKMAFSGKDYSIKLSGVKGGEWVVVVEEVKE